MIIRFFTGALFMTLITVPFHDLHAHGMKYNLIRGGIGIQALYNDETPMADSDVEVFQSDTSGKPIVKGITDSKGQFLFVPETDGFYIIKVDDGMGHSQKTRIRANKNLEVLSTPKAELSKLQMILMSACFLWGLAGTALYFKKR